ncbi:orotidine-5'-phosphate decarboxylase [Halanaerobacter jeridensis]|uniref:Orotidine 5'-phosphate decarboxylase n=1 Tax=Halanaerobacter jeridensis TaxID=706427 RepID=A0A938XSJ0_9FIRM|nr:orotidine-5'-phosphate decarboxylase [Halanaerobacter jeridensis]MBM7556039.1 orotidine-5'-phosphate decarboxylase [Halanaerobacter jeridensis]
MNFADKLIKAVNQKESHACVGLDPRWGRIPEEIRNKAIAEQGETLVAVAEAIIEFNQGIIDAVAQYVPVVKPQIAFYEQYGHQGIRAFEETVAYAQEKGLLVISDAKRNDIGSTAKAYADGHLGTANVLEGLTVDLNTDALTITPYLGCDGIKPFVNNCQKNDKGIFILVKTSNSSAHELQDIKAEDDELVFEKLADLVDEWGTEVVGEKGYSSIGAVVGATYPEEAEKLRNLMPHSYFLVPGYGAQGGGAEDVVPCFNEDGYGAVVNSSRGIIFAYEKEEYSADYKKAAQQAVINMNQDINTALKKYKKFAF